MRKRFVIIWLAALAAAACEPEATPLPVDIVPTTSPATIAAAPQTMRYGIDDAALLVIPPDDYALLADTAEIEIIPSPFDPATLAAEYDLVIGLGDLPESQRAPFSVTISLALNTALSPLDDPELAAVVRSAIQTDAFTAALELPGAEALPHESQSRQALRTTLANLGLPDGFDLSLASTGAPGAAAAAAQLAAVGIETQVSEFAPGEAPDLSRYHLILTTHNETLPAAFDASALVALAAVPVSYREAEGLTIEFTPGGLPLALP